jgi:hypothetical protein
MPKRNREFWNNHVTSFIKSSLRQAEYCRQNNINANYLSKLVRMKRQEENSSKDLVQIKPIPQFFFNNCFKLSLSDKYSILVPNDFSNETLKNILDVLETRL